MSGPSGQARDLARRVIELEAGDAAGGDVPRADVAAAHRALARFHERMRDLVGVIGFAALAGRALDRARSEHLVLREIDGPLDPTTAIEELRERDRDAVRAALESVLAHTIELLFRFLGTRLTVRVVRHAWPDLEAPGETERSTESP